MNFFVGLHQVHDAHEFQLSFISVNRLRKRKSPFKVGKWIMDSGAFTEISKHGHYRSSVEDYAQQVNRWAKNGELLAVVSQDYMCEPFILAKTGMTVREHQRLTIKRYDELFGLTDVKILPVLQGYEPREYVEHVEMYGKRLHFMQWVGVGSICKRNSNPLAVLEVLRAIHRVRPDLRLHGFGLKVTALAHPEIRAHLHTADSMAWSYAARRNYQKGIGYGANSPIEAHKFVKKITQLLLSDY